MGGPLASQSSPEQVKNSPLFLGVVAILSIEHAYANRMLRFGSIDLSKGVPIDAKLIKDTQEGNTTYYNEFKKQVNFYVKNQKLLETSYNVQYLNRKDWQGQSLQDITDTIFKGNNRLMVFSIEGGHNLSNVPIRKGSSRNPELQLKEIQDTSALDYISLNLCHVSYIPEQPLEGLHKPLTSFLKKLFIAKIFLQKVV
jgi:hypothetical protein